MRRSRVTTGRATPLGHPESTRMVRQQHAVRAAKLMAVLWIGVALAGCQYLRNALGVTKSSPNEFAVTTQPPLVLPPDLNLRPPQAGAAPRYALESSEQAKKVLFAQNPPAGEAVANGYSEGEIFLLGQATALNVDPGIRRTTAADAKLYESTPNRPGTRLPAAPPRLHVANFAIAAKTADIGAQPQPDETTVATDAIASETPNAYAFQPAALD